LVDLGAVLRLEGKFSSAANPNPSRRLGQRAALQRVVELYDAWQTPDLAQGWRTRMTP
jgi:hypothetical protein